MRNVTPPKSFDIFINYRRDDSRADAGRLYDRLAAHFGHDHVFMDIDDIDPGENFADVLGATLERCSAVLAVIGPRWLECIDSEGQPRLDDVDDFLRFEIRQALDRNLLLIPVLVGDARMPVANELPADIAQLALQQAVEIEDNRFHEDVDVLIEHLETTDPRLGRKFPVTRVALVVAGALLVTILGSWIFFGVLPLLDTSGAKDLAQTYAESGEQFAARGQHTPAIAEIHKALELQPADSTLLRKLIRLKRKRLLRSAFGDPNSAIHIGLRSDIARLAPVSAAEVDDALRDIYRLRSLDPTVDLDPELEVEEALILKASGQRALEAISLLERAVTLSPQHHQATAELGLLESVIGGKREGLETIRTAIEIAPANPRYHFYLAHALSEINNCATQTTEIPERTVGNVCSEALVAYKNANEFAIAEDYWSRRIKRWSAEQAFGILHRYALSEQGISTTRLSLDIAQRIDLINYFLPQEHRASRSGFRDYPLFWLATLHEAVDNLVAAENNLKQLLTESAQTPPSWMALYARILRKSGHDDMKLREIEAALDLNSVEER